MLCATCQLAVSGRSEIYKSWAGDSFMSVDYLHHRTYDSFHHAKQMGCLVCTMVWDKYHYQINSTEEPLYPLSRGCTLTYSFGTDIGDKGELTSWTFIIKASMSDLWVRNGWINFSMFRDKFIDYDIEFMPRRVNMIQTLDDGGQELEHEIGSSTASLSCVELAHHWISDCQAHHVECSQDSQSRHPLPMRVIDVGNFGDVAVRLFVSGSTSRYDKYLTLSHCWGGADILKLTSENEERLKAGFLIRDLPKTFRDAIYFTRALQMRYLWIDSLCILQDSVNDWRHQSALMGEIYRNCFCNIAATESSDSDGGLFVSRDPEFIKPLKLAINCTIKYAATPSQGVYYCYHSGLWGNMVEQAPLNTRGWVIQERLLSPRLLHFSKQIFWECGSGSACEIAPTGKPHIDGYGYEGFYKDLMAALQDISGSGVAKENSYPPAKRLYAAWWDLVSKYSSCKLSKENDILTAISGIAKIIAKAVDDEYFAGLWRSNLLIDLLWSVHQPSRFLDAPITERPIPFRAPSWSWASVKGQIWPDNRSSLYRDDMYIGPDVFVAQVLAVDIEAKGDDTAGEIDMGLLKIRGRTFNAVWDQDEDAHDNNLIIHIQDNVFEGCVYLDDREQYFYKREAKDTNLVCLPLVLEASSRIGCSGLIIEHAPESEEQYTRIGNFGALTPVGVEIDFERWLSKYEQGDRNIIEIV